jgi:hypothetical protein
MLTVNPHHNCRFINLVCTLIEFTTKAIYKAGFNKNEQLSGEVATHTNTKYYRDRKKAVAGLNNKEEIR